jgi:hypothetical protein
MSEHHKSGLIETRIMLHMQDRALEWFSAFVMLSWGLVLALPGDSLAGQNFYAFRRYGMTEDLWAWIFGAVGSARIIALYINGRWPRTPHIRMLGALFGAVSWGQVAWLITESTLATGVASTGIPVYAMLALADLFSIFRSAFDARYYRR